MAGSNGLRATDRKRDGLRVRSGGAALFSPARQTENAMFAIAAYDRRRQ